MKNILEIKYPDEWMKPENVADLMLKLLNLPKQIEISEIVVNRKSINQ